MNIPYARLQGCKNARFDSIFFIIFLKAWIFGSYARGEETPESDVDILVEFDKDARVSLMKHAGMIVDLEQKLNRPIDLVVNGTLLPFARKSADQDKILIYERAS